MGLSCDDRCPRQVKGTDLEVWAGEKDFDDTVQQLRSLGVNEMFKGVGAHKCKKGLEEKLENSKRKMEEEELTKDAEKQERNNNQG